MLLQMLFYKNIFSFTTFIVFSRFFQCLELLHTLLAYVIVSDPLTNVVALWLLTLLLQCSFLLITARHTSSGSFQC